MVTKVQKWGNSLGMRIPKSFAEEVSVSEGSTVDLSVSNGALVIRPVAPPRYELSSLLEGVTAENLHGEIPTGEAKGRESW